MPLGYIWQRSLYLIDWNVSSSFLGECVISTATAPCVLIVCIVDTICPSMHHWEGVSALKVSQHKKPSMTPSRVFVQRNLKIECPMWNNCPMCVKFAACLWKNWRMVKRTYAPGKKANMWLMRLWRWCEISVRSAKLFNCLNFLCSSLQLTCEVYFTAVATTDILCNIACTGMQAKWVAKI